MRRLACTSIVLGMACAIAVAACGDSGSQGTDGSPAGGAGAASGTATIGADVGIASVDPFKAVSGVETMLFPLLWSTLVKYEPDSPELHPALAERWSASDDARTHTFELRDAKFSNGEPVTAEHVVESLELATDPKTRFLYASSIPKVDDVAAVDRSTVRITLERPSTHNLLSSLALVPIVPSTAKARSTVSSGPFQVQDFQPDDHVTMTPNESYWGEEATVNELQIVRAADSTAAVTALRSGDLDALWNAPWGDLESLESEGVETVMSAVQAAQVITIVDTTSAPFDDVKARQALVYATDKAKIIETAYAGKVRVSRKNLPIADDDPLFASELPDIPFDLERAKQLFAEAGVTEGTTLKFQAVAGSYKQWLLTAQIMQADLKEIGIDLEIETSDFAGWAAHHTPIGKKFPDTVTPNFFTGHPSTTVMTLWLPGPCPCNFENDEYIAAVTDADTVTNPDRRTALYREAQRIFQEQAPTVILGQTGRPVAVRSSVEGVWEDPTTIVHFENVRRVAD